MSFKTPEELTCDPIDTYAELMMYIKNLPPWRSLCKELTPHSKFKINNIDIHSHTEIFLDEPETFCHISPDTEDPPRTERIHLPKTLVCHDMANGYHDDSFVDGTGERNAYTFYNWAAIDTFCYFSHHLITIPPLSWINVAHAHGVKVIGTLITEWSEGVKFWDEVLQSESMFQNTASALVAIAKSLKFDGWLLNVENKISKPKLLLEFVQHLRFLLHQEIPNAELIWYDSVTIDGHLNWQNGLNDKNKAFFNACDGIFTNYSWREFDITTSAIEAGDRITDLYIGIDVWGRNFYGGGQFNTQAAIKLVHEEGCSLAIFAPAWTHEAMSSDITDPNYVAMAEELDVGQQFLLRDRALWGSFWPYLTTRLPSELPFKTSFCRGLGKKRRMYGEVISRSPWYNLRHQQYQPNSSHGPHGYILSTDDVIKAVSKRGIFKDTKGILRVRDDFQASRVELFSLKSKPKENKESLEANDDHIKNESEPPKTTQANIERSYVERRSVDEKDQPRTEPDQDQKKKTAFRQQPTRKRTIKECLKDFFAGKSQNKRVSIAGSGHKYIEDTDVKRLTSDGTTSVPKKIDRKESAIEFSCIKLPLETYSHVSSDKSLVTNHKESAVEFSSKDSAPETSSHASSDKSLVTNHKESAVEFSSKESAPGTSSHASSGKSLVTNHKESGVEFSSKESAPGTSSYPSSGKSLVTMSVNLRLGQSAAGPHPRIALAAVPQERECLEVTQEDSFNGGSCLRVHPSDEICREHRYTRLLHCDFPIADSLVVCVVTKTLPDCPGQYLTVRLHTVSGSGASSRVLLVGRDIPQTAHAGWSAAAGGVLTLSPLASTDHSFKDIQKYLLLNETGFYVPIENYFGWIVRYYLVQLAGSRVTSVNLRTGSQDGPILLGHFGICHKPSDWK